MRPWIARPVLWVAVPAVMIVAGTAGCAQVDDTPRLSLGQAEPSPPAPTRLPESPAATGQHVDPQGNPTKVVIPAIGVDVDLVPLGLNADGSMEVPDFGLAGWYTEGPKPGHAGPAAIVAHVDSRAGPDVFYRLGDLATGDEIHVAYDSGDTVTFFAVRSEQAPKGELPAATIWPTTNERLLTLITCGGEFDRTTRHYRDNLIVYTSLMRPSGPRGTLSR